MSHWHSIVDLNRKGPNHDTVLDLRTEALGDAEAKEVAQLLKGNTSITMVYLNHNQISATGAAELARAFQVNRTIKTVSSL